MLLLSVMCAPQAFSQDTSLISSSTTIESIIQSKVSSSPKLQEKILRTSDGVKLHFIEGGKGEQTIFFIPGWLMPAEIFNLQLSYFSQNYHVVSYSPRSQGKSDIYLGKQLVEKRAKDISEILKAVKADQFILVGWSLGVMEALDYVSRFGTNGLKGLVLIDNSIGEGQAPKASISSNTKISTEKFIQFAKSFSRAIFNLPPPPEILQSVEQSALRLSFSPQAAYQILKKSYSREFYKNVIYQHDVPVWYAITPRYSEQASLLIENHPISRYTIYDHDAGHALFVDQADLFNQDMAKFLGTLN